MILLFLIVLWHFSDKCYPESSVYNFPGTVLHHNMTVCVMWAVKSTKATEIYEISSCWKLSFSSDENNRTSFVIKN